MLVCSHSFIHSNQRREHGQRRCPRYILAAIAEVVGETSQWTLCLQKTFNEKIFRLTSMW